MKRQGGWKSHTVRIESKEARTYYIDTVLVIIKLTKNPVPLRFRCSCGKLILCRYITIFAIFKNAVYSLEPGETPSNSASHQVPNYAQRS